jgi:hypothetical protein
MIIGWKKDADHANRFDIFNRETGEKITGTRQYIFYADDEAGYYLRYPKNADNLFYLRDSRTHELWRRDCSMPEEYREVAWERVDLPIEIRPKSWRDRPPLL